MPLRAVYFVNFETSALGTSYVSEFWEGGGVPLGGGGGVFDGFDGCGGLFLTPMEQQDNGPDKQA